MTEKTMRFSDMKRLLGWDRYQEYFLRFSKPLEDLQKEVDELPTDPKIKITGLTIYLSYLSPEDEE